MDERISWFPVVSDGDMAPDVRALSDKAKERTGLVPNVFRVYAWRPERFLKWFSHFRDVMRESPGLSAADREMIGVVVSAENRCLYCTIAHGAELRQLLGDPVLADTIATDYKRAGLDARRRAMCDFAVKLTRSPAAVEEADIQHLRDVGLTEEDVWDVAEVAAMFNFSNRMASATGMRPNTKYFGR
ncbi:MAG TPA: peroxidase-related enzyme [Chloroflexota bacterium]|nr:peroxidase-related enzyme [Chloroflexota bacterium]